jgi:hypothetical protein
MKKVLTLTGIVLVIFSSVWAQQPSESPPIVYENLYLLPKRGMEDKLEAAIKAHNQKFHPDGPYRAVLRKVEYGEKAGWYVWVFGPATYSALDTRPDKENGHADDWSQTVDPLIETYGKSNLWEFNSDLSYGMDILKKSNYYEAWVVDIKRGEYYRFKAMIEKLKKAYESIGTTAFLVYNNPFHSGDNADVSILWSFNSYDEWSKDSGAKVAYEKLYGVGSWQNMLDEWEDVSVDYKSEIRKMVK